MAERMADGLRSVLIPEGGIRPRGEPGKLPPGRLYILGRWRATIRLEYRRLTRDLDTEREAPAWLAEIRLKADRGACARAQPGDRRRIPGFLAGKRGKTPGEAPDLPPVGAVYAQSSPSRPG